MKVRQERGQSKFLRSEEVHKAGVLVTFRKLNMKEEGRQCGHKKTPQRKFLDIQFHSVSTSSLLT